MRRRLYAIIGALALAGALAGGIIYAQASAPAQP